MPKLSDFAPKPLVLGAALVGTTISDAFNKPANAQPPVNQPAVQGDQVPGAAPAASAEYLRGRQEGIELGRQIAKLESALDDIDKSSAILDSTIRQSLNPDFKNDWQDDYRKITTNQKFFRDQIKNGAINAELAFKTISITVDNLETWAKVVKSEAEEKRDTSPRSSEKRRKGQHATRSGNEPTTFHDFLANPGMENVHVYMSLQEYRAYQALNLIQKLKIEGMPDLQESLPRIEEGLNLIANPNNKFRKGKGLGPSIAEPFNQREAKQKSLRELNEESRERQRLKRESR